MTPQSHMVLTHLRAGRPLTPLTALRLYGIGRLSARVHELKRAGYRIESELVEREVRNGEYARVAQYRMGK